MRWWWQWWWWYTWVIFHSWLLIPFIYPDFALATLHTLWLLNLLVKQLVLLQKKTEWMKILVNVFYSFKMFRAFVQGREITPKEKKSPTHHNTLLSWKRQDEEEEGKHTWITVTITKRREGGIASRIVASSSTKIQMLSDVIMSQEKRYTRRCISWNTTISHDHHHHQSTIKTFLREREKFKWRNPCGCGGGEKSCGRNTPMLYSFGGGGGGVVKCVVLIFKDHVLYTRWLKPWWWKGQEKRKQHDMMTTVTIFLSFFGWNINDVCKKWVFTAPYIHINMKKQQLVVFNNFLGDFFRGKEIDKFLDVFLEVFEMGIFLEAT